MIEPGACLCIDEILNKKNTKYQFITGLPCTMYSCSTYDLKKYFGLENIKKLPNYKLYSAEDEDVINHYLQRQLWKKYRSNYSKELHVEYKKWKNLNKVSYRGSKIPNIIVTRDKDDDRILREHFNNKMTHSNYYTSRVDQFIKNKPLKNKDMKISERLKI